jgi:tetratricopeptide (TPR) repeat protein
MKSRNRVRLLAGLALFTTACLSAPSSAQKDETAAALSARINELGRAGKYAEARSLAQQQLQSLEKKYGPIHRDVAAALHDLAHLYGDQGNDAEAEPMFKRSIAIYQKAAGPEDPAVATFINNLRQVDKVQGRYATAELETFDRLKADPAHCAMQQFDDSAPIAADSRAARRSEAARAAASV